MYRLICGYMRWWDDFHLQHGFFRINLQDVQTMLHARWQMVISKPWVMWCARLERCGPVDLMTSWWLPPGSTWKVREKQGEIELEPWISLNNVRTWHDMVTCCNVSRVRIPRNWNLLRRCTSHPWRFPSLQGNGRLTCWIEAMLDSYLPNILDKEDGGKSAEMWIEAWDMIGTVVRNTTWNCGSKLKSYCHYSDVNMDVTCFNLCKITTWSRNKMPEACCKAALIWDLILFEEFHIFVRFISSLINFPYISPFCCSVVCLFNPVFFFLFSVALAHFAAIWLFRIFRFGSKKTHRHLFQAMTLKMRRRGGVLLLALALLREAFVAPEGSGMGELP